MPQGPDFNKDNAASGHQQPPTAGQAADVEIWLKAGEQPGRRIQSEDPEIFSAARPTTEISTDQTSILNLQQPSYESSVYPGAGHHFDLEEIANLAISRNCAQTAELLLAVRDVLVSETVWQDDPGLLEAGREFSWRMRRLGNMAFIRGGSGTAYLMSDLEGDFWTLLKVFQEENLIERLYRNDPDDLVYFCHLGDMIDRRETGSFVVDFLFHLKVLFPDQIVLLPGNHELSQGIQSLPPATEVDQDGHPGRGGFLREVVDAELGRASFQSSGPRYHPALIRMIEEQVDFARHFRPKSYTWQEFVQQLPLLWEQGNCGNFELNGVARGSLWLLYNQVFRLLPLVVGLGDDLFGVHGGPTVQGVFANLASGSKSEATPDQCRRYLAFGKDPLAVTDFTWSDVESELEGIALNDKRQNPKETRFVYAGMKYGKQGIEDSLSMMGYKLLLRGHQRTMPPGSAFKKSEAEVALVETYLHGTPEQAAQAGRELAERQKLRRELHCSGKGVAWQYGSAVTVNGGVCLKADLSKSLTSPDDLGLIIPSDPFAEDADLGVFDDALDAVELEFDGLDWAD